jgi:hypothetical protein
MSRLNASRALLAALACVVWSLAAAATASADSRVTVSTGYVRQDGGSDSVISTCSSSNTATGSNRRQQNEPAVAIDPGATSFIVASSNDYCGVPSFGDAFQGIYTSTNGGSSWTDSLLPGYPGDTSGVTSTLDNAGDTNSGDPVLDWDNSGHLFAGGIAFNRTAAQAESGVTPTNGNMYVSTWNKVAVSSSAPLGIRFERTVIVGKGTPSANFQGRFNDKPSIKADDWSILTSPFAGNVYVSWTLFTGVGVQDRVLFSRSTDSGATFSKPIVISQNVPEAEGTDVAVAPDGTVYVVWRQFAFVGTSNAGDGIVFVKSTDGGKTFSKPTFAFSISPYDRSDTYVSGGSARDCGSLSSLCLSGFTFPRTQDLPQATADSSGNVYVSYEQLKPSGANGDTYHPDGQSQVAVQKSTDGGASWSGSTIVDNQSVGDQFWPNLAFDSSNGTLAVIYYDSRADPGYSVNRPPGNGASTPTAKNVCIASGVGTQPCDVLDTYIATSTNGGSTWTPSKVSSIGNQPDYEMFGGRTVPFQGDYIWVDARGGAIYGTWTDNRDVVPGSDRRENGHPADGDGFDVHQCRTSATAPDTCSNAGGLDQNIYGGSP